MLDFLKRLVNIETPSGDKKAQDKIFTLLETHLKELGFYCIRVKRNASGGYLYARPKNRKKNNPTQLLLGHCDTVWELGTLKHMPVIHTRRKIAGPGVYDMKAGITQIIYALKTINDLELESAVTPLILINSDEEVGSKESANIITRLSKVVKRAFILEPPLGLEGKLKIARKGIGRFTITVKGKAAHAGLDPQKGVNAIVELSYQVQQLYAMNDFERGITVNIGLIEGGYSPNVVAAESNAVVDVRVLNDTDAKYITSKIRQLKPMLDDVELIVEGGIGRPPMEFTPRNKHLWGLAKKNANIIGLELEYATAGGGSDGNTTSLYTATLDGLGTTGDGAHAEHEFIFPDKLVERTALLILLILEDNNLEEQ
jgi:glutamate carboxypeptidase